MTASRRTKAITALTLALCLIGASIVVVLNRVDVGRTEVIAYFDNSNGIFTGDDVMILGVPVGTIDKIEPEPERVKVSFHFDDRYKVPADANAVIISPTLVTARAIQLTPAYVAGPVMRNGAVIPEQRTAVPIEFDDLKEQLERLTQTLQPTEPGGVSTVGALVNTAAENLRGQGANIRDALIQLSRALSTLGDHSDDVFGTVKNLSVLVSALQSSTGLMRQLNGNLASVSGLLANDSDEIGAAVRDLNVAIDDVRSFVADNGDALGTASDKLASISEALVESLDDIKQALHVAPNAFQNFSNIYEAGHASLTGILAANNFANPIDFICGAVQAASRLDMEQSAKLCVQYLAPIVKNRQFNFPPIGANPFVGPMARPNEVTFSEDWLRPLTEAGRIRDYYEGALPETSPPEQPVTATPPPLLAAEAPEAHAPGPAPLPGGAAPTDPSSGLPGMMLPPGGQP